jgi:hypothetical protein
MTIMPAASCTTRLDDDRNRLSGVRGEVGLELGEAGGRALGLRALEAGSTFAQVL